MRSLVASLVLLGWTGAGCGGGKAQPVDEVVLCDRSSSAGICSEEVVRGAGEAFLGANPPPGSRFVVLVVGCGIEDVVRTYEIKVPDRWGRGADVARTNLHMHFIFRAMDSSAWDFALPVTGTRPRPRGAPWEKPNLGYLERGAELTLLRDGLERLPDRQCYIVDRRHSQTWRTMPI